MADLGKWFAEVELYHDAIQKHQTGNPDVVKGQVELRQQLFDNLKQKIQPLLEDSRPSAESVTAAIEAAEQYCDKTIYEHGMLEAEALQNPAACNKFLSGVIHDAHNTLVFGLIPILKGLNPDKSIGRF